MAFGDRIRNLFRREENREGAQFGDAFRGQQWRDGEINYDDLEAGGRRGRQARREAREIERRQGTGMDAALNSYFMDRAQSVIEGESFREDPNRLAEEAAQASAAASGQAAAQAQDLLRTSMAGGPQQQGDVQSAVDQLGDRVRDTYFQNYAAASAADADRALSQQREALALGQAAAAAGRQRMEERTQLILAMLSGAVGSLGTFGLGDQPSASGPAPAAGGAA